MFYKKLLPNGRIHIYFCGLKIASYKKKNPRKSEFIILEGGIGNRLKALFSFLRLCHVPGKKVFIYWKKEGTSVNNDFHELFDFNVCSLKEISEYTYVFQPLLTGWRLLLKKGELSEFFEQTYPRESDNPSLPTIDFEYNRIPQNIRDLYLPYFEQLKPSLSVISRMKQIQMPKKYVAVHIRLSKEWAFWNRGGYEQIPLFIKEMKKYPKDTVFFLASFDFYVSETIKKAFPGRIIELPDKNLESSIDAVAELYLLSKGTELIATYGSTFSEVAWWLSGCSQKVNVVGSRKNWKNDGHPDNVK